MKATRQILDYILATLLIIAIWFIPTFLITRAFFPRVEYTEREVEKIIKVYVPVSERLKKCIDEWWDYSLYQRTYYESPMEGCTKEVNLLDKSFWNEK